VPAILRMRHLLEFWWRMPSRPWTILERGRQGTEIVAAERTYRLGLNEWRRAGRDEIGRPFERW